jgi:hypothetical protein
MAMMTTGTSGGYQVIDKSKGGALGGYQPPRRFDICMVWKYKTKKNVKFEESAEDAQMGNQKQLRPPEPADENKMKVWKQRRESLLKQMKNCGLNLFCYYSRDRDEIFVKVGADADKLKATAARMKYKLQMKQEYLEAYAEYRQDVRGRPGDAKGKYYSQFYKRHTEAEDTPDEASMFTTCDKIFLIHHMITSKDKDCAGINLGQLLHRDTSKGLSLADLCRQKPEDNKAEALLNHYFPLHEEKKLKELTSNMWNWIWMPTDHAHKVRDYFGDKVAFYYLWMSFYWKWLAIPGCVGAVLQILDVCFRSPDNVTAVPFCIFLAIWSIFLPHFWRRQEAKYAIAWGTFDMVPDLEPCRPEHHGEPRINPVTAQVENYYPWQNRMWKYMKSMVVIAITGVLLLFAIFVMLYCRHKFKDEFSGPLVHGIAAWQLIMAIFVEITNAMLTQIAKYLTTEENHRTQSDHDTQLLAKVFAFKFVNSYFVLYFVAFFKKNANLFGTKLECIRQDCFLDLQVALAIFMIVRLVTQNAVRFLGPKVKLYMKNFSTNSRQAIYNFFHPSSPLELAYMSLAEQQSKREPYDPFQDFDETLITHGYATLFSVTAPWVCTATLLWIIGETILDVRGLTETTQRPLPVRLRNNEPWDTAFDIYGFLATITNVLAIIFASKEYGYWTYTEKLMLFIMVIHVVGFAKLLIKSIFPEIPRSVHLLNLKQVNMVHRCLENIKVEPQQDLSQFVQNHGQDTFEVMEQDMLDDEDVEPELNLRESWRTMRTGLVGALDSGLVCILCVTVVLTMMIAVMLFVYNHFGGRFS